MKTPGTVSCAAAVGVATVALGVMPFLKKGDIDGGLAPLPLAIATASVCAAAALFWGIRAPLGRELREAGITAALVSLAPLVTAAAERWAWGAELSPPQWGAVVLVIAAAAALAARPGRECPAQQRR